MAKAAGLKGLNIIMKNLNKEIKGMKNRSMSGLIQASILIRNDMDNTYPVIPVDTGNLRSSWFTFPIRKGFRTGLIIGFSANYATYIHELVGQNINWTRPNSGAKFFEASIKRNINEIRSIIGLNISVDVANAKGGSRIKGTPMVAQNRPSAAKLRVPQGIKGRR